MIKKIELRTILLVLLIVILIIADFLIGRYFSTSNNDLGKTIGRIEKTISQKENIAKKNLDDLITISEQISVKKVFGIKEFSELSKSEKISFLVYEHDSLIYWSDNKVSISDISSPQLLKNGFFILSNGYYDIIKLQNKKITAIAAILIKSKYKYENDYLINDFEPGFNSNCRNVEILDSGNINKGESSSNNAFFPISFREGKQINPILNSIKLALYFLEFISLLLLLLFIGRKIFKKSRSPGLYATIFSCSILLLRYILFELKIPQSIYTTDLFSPIFYASSEFLPSLGDLLLNCILVFILLVLIYKYAAPEKNIKKQKSSIRFVFSVFIIFLSGLLFLFVINLIKSLVIDSTISFNLNQIFSISGLTILGLLVISLLLLSYYLFSSILFKILWAIGVKWPGFLSALFISVSIFIFLKPYLAIFDYYIIGCFALFCLTYQFFRLRKGEGNQYYEIAIFLLLFTYASYYTISNSNHFKEIEKRKYFAEKLSSGEDPLGEYIYSDIQKSIQNDKFIAEKLAKYPSSELEIKEYLIKKHFTGYWEKYKVQVTICAKNDSLLMQANSEKTNCYNYFSSLSSSIGKTTSCNNFYRLNYGTGGNNYLSEVDFNSDTSSFRIFIELNSKFIPKGLGYPELLIDKKHFLSNDLANYSYAKYYQNNLVDAYGKYYYSMNYQLMDSLKTNDYLLFNGSGYSHLLFKTDHSSFVIISKKKGNLLDTLAPFSILFSFFSIVILIFLVFYKLPLNKNSLMLDFKNRLQLAMISIILISFIIIGTSTYLFIKDLNNDKNIDILSEKSMSILIELQGKLSDIGTMGPEQQNFLNNFLGKLSNVFFTDINVFDTNGDLISSSRQEIFNEGLISRKINPNAYFELSSEKKTFFIQKEFIGKLEYYSAYVPFYNRNNELVYYINLPYFAKESDLKKELSSFLMAFINIYVFFIAISIIIALFVGSRITRPLNIIREKIGNIRLGSKNEKINWPRRDEIGGLIMEYNRMIDEITESADLLARSERESAWREMAMQVAHEIKNPLTPMKLSIQYLDKAWKEQAPNWESILKRFTKNMVEQIDSLSAIASEFSYFAKMPLPQNEEFDIIPTIENSIAIFSGSDHINIRLEHKDASNTMVFADKKQIIRVMNNLIHNAVQAIGNKTDGMIKIKVENRKQKILISIKDNGEGISADMKERVFVPSFSTKTEGMGLGLAIVKGIIENSGGNIWFESDQNKGTTFFIELPEVG